MLDAERGRCTPDSRAKRRKLRQTACIRGVLAIPLLDAAHSSPQARASFELALSSALSSSFPALAYRFLALTASPLPPPPPPPPPPLSSHAVLPAALPLQVTEVFVIVSPPSESSADAPFGPPASALVEALLAHLRADSVLPTESNADSRSQTLKPRFQCHLFQDSAHAHACTVDVALCCSVQTHRTAPHWHATLRNPMQETTISAQFVLGM
eukprot:2977341-Rhodomonas_salina.1